MITQCQIGDLVQTIARECKPERIILFGSYACGTARPESDVDLLVIKGSHIHPAQEAIQILDRLRPRFAVDLLVRSPQDVQQRLVWKDAFLEEITRTGTVLYDATH